MKTIDQIALRPHYRSGDDDLIRDFYLPCLSTSTQYDRAVGYFRSSIFRIISRDVVNFVKNDGNIRIICSTELDANDAKEIEMGYNERLNLVKSSIDKMIDNLIYDVRQIDNARLLATLIAINRLEIRFAFRNDGSGIYHEKIGIFSDRYGNSVSFIGSANETLSGWFASGNYESIEVFTSWESSNDAKRIERHKRHFDNIWNNRENGITVIGFSEATVKKLLTFASSDIQEYTFSLAKEEANMPCAKTPMKHQYEAIENWKKAGFKGIFEHATGSGKTITAIIAIREHIETGKPSLVLVPSELLLNQWENELRSEISDVTILSCGAGNTRWKALGKLRAMSSGVFNDQKRVVISTMQTAATTLFQSNLVGSPNLLVVADEVHQIGSSHLSNCLRIQSGKRLGLSATPTRYGDPEGTQRIFDYFGNVIEPKFTLQDAINANRLVQYQYFPLLTSLAVEEEEDWNDLSNKIRLETFKLEDKNSNRQEALERIKILLVRRSRIAKKAYKKIASAAQSIQENYEDDDRWLVYCEDIDQLNQIKDELERRNIKSIEYHSELDDGCKKATLEWFKRFGGILLSVRCLDEGVDIPQVNKAMIIASSQNPRQFIQRRGRVLRNFTGKGIAVIFDILVVPASIESKSPQFSLLKSELLRAIEFSTHAVNKTCGIELSAIADNFGILDEENEVEMEEQNG